MGALAVMWVEGWIRESGEKDESSGREDMRGIGAIQSFREKPGFWCPRVSLWRLLADQPRVRTEVGRAAPQPGQDG